MRLLVLGGTAFLGRAVATHARDAGHDVTCLARGTNAAPDGAHLAVGDRDAAEGLATVRDTSWDCVIDVSRQPGQVRRAVAQLTARHWVFVSSANVYARFDRLEQDESAHLLPPLDGEVMADMTQYGPAKVACENAIRNAVGSATIIRCGLIGGFGDWSARTGYYPWRFAHPTAADVLVPDDPDFPMALIDVDDLSAWIVRCAEGRLVGTFNATGPTTTLGEILAECRELAGPLSPAARAVPADILCQAGVTAWMGPASLPLWIDDPVWRYFATMDTSAARRHGLVTRPVRETLAAAATFEEVRDVPRQAGLTDDDERRVRTLLDTTKA